MPGRHSCNRLRRRACGCQHHCLPPNRIARTHQCAAPCLRRAPLCRLNPVCPAQRSQRKAPRLLLLPSKWLLTNRQNRSQIVPGADGSVSVLKVPMPARLGDAD